MNSKKMESNKALLKLSILLSKLFRLKRWQLILYLFILTQIFAFTLNFTQSIIWWGNVNLDLLLIGAVDVVVIVAILGPLLIYLTSQITRYEDYSKASKAQNLQDQKFRHYVENTLDIVTVLDKNGLIKYESPSVEKVLGYQSFEMIGKSVFEYLHPDEREYIINLLKEKINEYDSSVTIEAKFLRRDGSWANLTVSARNLLHDELVKGIVCNSKDITKIKEVNIQLSRLLEEKKTLIQEIHHRVKNNFQSVSSMLYLQANMIENEQLKEILNVSRNRIHSLALLHENLQNAEDVSSVNINRYFTKLVKIISGSYDVKNKEIKLIINIDESFEIPTNHAIQLGLVLNELISNIFKHAFVESETGEIQINFDRSNGTNYFMVKDNGIGITLNFDPATSKSLGLRIVNMISKQLKGEYTIQNKNGTEFILKFPSKE